MAERKLTEAEMDIVEMLEMRLCPEMADVMERYDLSVCEAAELMGLALRLIHGRSHVAEELVAGDPRWN